MFQPVIVINVVIARKLLFLQGASTCSCARYCCQPISARVNDLPELIFRVMSVVFELPRTRKYYLYYVRQGGFVCMNATHSAG